MLTCECGQPDSDKESKDEMLRQLTDETAPLVPQPTEVPPPRELAEARKLLLISHLFSQFSDTTWQFCLILFLAAFADYESLLLVSTYGLVSGLMVCVFGSVAGQYVDSTNRLRAARLFIWSQNICVLVATFCCYTLLHASGSSISSEETDDVVEITTETSSRFEMWLRSRLNGVPTDAFSISLLVGIHLLGGLEALLSRGFRVAIERDWIVVMSKTAGNTAELGNAPVKEWLSRTNVAMKQIDLSCKVLAPSVAGFVISAFDSSGGSNHGSDLSGAAILVGILNISALVAEYICTALIYSWIPQLSSKETASEEDHDDSGAQLNDAEPDTENLQAPKETAAGDSARRGRNLCQFPYGLRVYMEQSVSLGGLALALLYLNALTFGALMTAYLVWRGMKFETIGVWRGISSAIGLLGTFVYHASVQRMTIVSTGMWSIIFQFSCLSISYASLFVQDYKTSLSMLIGGVCLSRIGLWVFDISITQLMQENIPAPIRGLTGGVQEALNAFFGLLSFVLGIFFPDPKEFPIYVCAGYASVFIATWLYAFGVHFNRGKLNST